MQTLWQILRDTIHLTVNLLDDLRSIRSRCLLYHHDGRRMPIHRIRIVVSISTYLHTSHITKTENLPVSLTPDYDVSKLFRSRETSPIFHRIDIRIVMVLTKSTRSSLYILISQGRRNILRDQLILRHLIRFEPQTHIIVATIHHHLTYTRDALQPRDNVDTHVIVEEILIKLLIIRI